MYVIAYFYKDSFPIPEKDSQISLKLEHFAELFEMDTLKAHDALEDCEYLKQLLSQIKYLLPNLGKYGPVIAMDLRAKSALIALKSVLGVNIPDRAYRSIQGHTDPN